MKETLQGNVYGREGCHSPEHKLQGEKEKRRVIDEYLLKTKDKNNKDYA
ncbi:MAG: hypothetical protein QG670_2335 [Thermoproteota archaeon]|nr:hypothetical protein [Thermoproteota archaeon]